MAPLLDEVTDYTVEKVRALCASPDELARPLSRSRAACLPREKEGSRVLRVAFFDSFFDYLGPEPREILDDLQEEGVADGKLQFTLPDVLKVMPISHRGNVEVLGRFGGADQICNVVKQLQSPH
ncbi:MAG TPA: hypothetical protein VJA21_05135 [Verrucomicrobiae bacterium]